MDESNRAQPATIPSPTTLTADDYDRMRAAIEEARQPPAWTRTEWSEALSRVHASLITLAPIDLMGRWLSRPSRC